VYNTKRVCGRWQITHVPAAVVDTWIDMAVLLNVGTGTHGPLGMSRSVVGGGRSLHGGVQIGHPYT
jgi:hypothetical protein